MSRSVEDRTAENARKNVWNPTPRSTDSITPGRKPLWTLDALYTPLVTAVGVVTRNPTTTRVLHVWWTSSSTVVASSNGRRADAPYAYERFAINSLRSTFAIDEAATPTTCRGYLACNLRFHSNGDKFAATGRETRHDSTAWRRIGGNIYIYIYMNLSLGKVISRVFRSRREKLWWWGDGAAEEIKYNI